MKIALATHRLLDWYDGDIGGVIDQVRRADALGVDQVVIADHILRVEDSTGYPYGKPGTPPDYPWHDPLVLLGAIAATTDRIRLSTGILVSPIRPAPLLAKQLVTLDHISRGRVDIGIGVGWQKAEYDASSIPWERRFSRMTDQMRAMKALWTQAPASHHGEFYDFDGIYSLPFPVQPGGVPLWFGFALRGPNVDRIAELGDGWLPAETRPEVLAREIAQIKAAMVATGRDPAGFQVRVGLRAPRGARDIRAALQLLPAYADAGVTMVTITPYEMCERPDQVDDLLKIALEAVRG